MSRQQRITRHLRKTLNTREYKTTGSKKRNVEETDNGGEENQPIHTSKLYNLQREDQRHP